MRSGFCVTTISCKSALKEILFRDCYGAANRKHMLPSPPPQFTCLVARPTFTFSANSLFLLLLLLLLPGTVRWEPRWGKKAVANAVGQTDCSSHSMERRALPSIPLKHSPLPTFIEPPLLLFRLTFSVCDVERRLPILYYAQ